MHGLFKRALAGSAFAALVAGSALASGTLTYVSTDTPLPIPDVSSATSSITVPSGDWTGRDQIRDVNVYVRLNHTWNSDLTVTVIGPDGTRVVLWSAVGGSSDNFDVTIDDEAASNISSNAPGTYRPASYPSQRLCTFDGQAPAGTWRLEVADTVGADVGTLLSWSVTVEGQEGRFDNPCEPERVRGRGRGLGSHANNGGGNGDDLPPPGANRGNK